MRVRLDQSFEKFDHNEKLIESFSDKFRKMGETVDEALSQVESCIKQGYKHKRETIDTIEYSKQQQLSHEMQLGSHQAWIKSIARTVNTLH